MKHSKLLTVCALLMGGALFAQEAEPVQAEVAPAPSKSPYLSLGIRQRNFDKPEMRSPSLHSMQGIYLNNDGVTSISDYGQAIGAIGTGTGILGSGSTGHWEFCNVVEVTGGDFSSKGTYGNAEQLAPVIGYHLPLCDYGNLSLGVEANFACFQLDSASRYANAFGFLTTQYDVIVQNGVATPQGAYDDGVEQAAPMLTGSYKSSFTLDLYQLDLGASLGYSFDCGLQLSLAAGPTITYADMDSHCYARYGVDGWQQNLRDGSDVNQLIFGLYASVGASYWFTERIGLACEVRYDEAFRKASTSLVEQDLDSWGSSLKLLYNF